MNPPTFFFTDPYRKDTSFKTMPCPIEILDLDLQVMILIQINDIETLVSVLKATPRLCRAFSSDREKILISVLVNTYGAELYSEAVSAAKMTTCPRNWVEMHSFITDLDRSRVSTKLPENDLSTLISMCQLHWALQYHVQRFSEPAIDFISSCAKGFFRDNASHHAQQADITSALSSVEQGRLRRAFLRFQLYSRLFCNVNPIEVGKRNYLVDRMPSWEIEELASVYSYITRGIQQTFDLAGEDYMSACTTEVGLAKTVGGVLDDTDSKEMFNPGWISSVGPLGGGLPQATTSPRCMTGRYGIRLKGDIFDRPGIDAIEPGDVRYQARLKAYMLSSGLRFLRGLFESTGEARLAMVSARDDFSSSLQPPSMNLLLDYSMTATWANANDDATPEPDGTESSRQSNLAWQWAHTDEESEDWRTGIYHELRRWGYVFWDVARMEHSGIMVQRYVIWRDVSWPRRISNP